MLRSIYSAISGLKANQEKLDVIGNNIANVGTTAYKSQTIRFEDMISQNSSQGSGSTTNSGGVNPVQIGLGVKVAGIDTLNTVGDMQATSRSLDVAIDGAGYFMVGKGAVPASNADGVLVNDTSHVITPNTSKMEVSYTKDGGFELDDKGNLVTSDGLRVLGYPVTDGANTTPASIDYTGNGDPTINYVNVNGTPTAGGNLVPLVIPDSVVLADGSSSKVQSFSIEKDGQIKAVLANNTVTVLGQIAMASFANEGGLSKVGNDQYQSTPSSGSAVVRSGIAAGTANDNSAGYGNMEQGMLEMSNVDLAQQFTDMIVASRAFQANGKVITTADDILTELIALKR